MAKAGGDNLVADLALGALLAVGGWFVWSRYLSTGSRIVPTGDDGLLLEKLRLAFNPRNVPAGTGSATAVPSFERDDSAPGVLFEGDLTNIPIFGRRIPGQ